MDPDLLFTAANVLVLPGWALLILAPRRRWSARLVAAMIIPTLLGLLYASLIVVALPGTDGGFGSLAGVRALFANPYLLVAGWVHYLAFDLFIGSWEVRDAQRVGIRHAFVIPCLILTFLLGPVGLLVYLGLRAGKRQVWFDDPA